VPAFSEVCFSSSFEASALPAQSPSDSRLEGAVELVLRRSPGDKRLLNQCTVIYGPTRPKWTWLLPNFTANPVARAPEVRLRFPMDFPQAPMPSPPGEYAYSWSSGIFFRRIIEEGTFTIDRQDRR
jgi:hypothetical protein